MGNLGRYLVCSKKASKIGDGEFKTFERCSSDLDPSWADDVDAASTAASSNNSPDAAAPYSLKSSDSLESQHLNRCSVLLRQLVLALIEILLSLLLFSPELVLGVIRLVRGIWAQATGSATWKPQDEVEKEVEQNLSLCFVFKKTWVVFVCGALYVTYVSTASLCHGASIHFPYSSCACRSLNEQRSFGSGSGSWTSSARRKILGRRRGFIRDGDCAELGPEEPLEFIHTTVPCFSTKGRFAILHACAAN